MKGRWVFRHVVDATYAVGGFACLGVIVQLTMIGVDDRRSFFWLVGLVLAAAALLTVAEVLEGRLRHSRAEDKGNRSEQ